MRIRTGDDLDECVRLATAVHELDGYPAYLPTDLRGFLETPDALAAWVAEHEGGVVGHVALHRRTNRPALAMASAALQRPADQLGVVARLLVDPHWRRRGAGRSLLEVATSACRDRGLYPILEVATGYTSAIGLYERCGWVRVGQVTMRLAGEPFDEFVYLAPES